MKGKKKKVAFFTNKESGVQIPTQNFIILADALLLNSFLSLESAIVARFFSANSFINERTLYTHVKTCFCK